MLARGLMSDIYQPILAYNETSLPARSLEERLQLAKDNYLALEVANQGNFPISNYQDCGVKVVSVQTYEMHDFHPLHPEPENRQIAVDRVFETLEIAARLNARHIVTVCGFGHKLVDKPQERCLDFFEIVGDRAGQLGVKIAIEPLSPQRVAIFNSPIEVVELIETLNRPQVFSLLLDTGHLADSNIELNDFFSNWKYPISELQLKGLNSTPPEPNIPVPRWIESLPKVPEIICVEHRQPIELAQFKNLIYRFQSELHSTTRNPKGRMG
jgi:sugar phosphate isomerase/epimerase